MPWRRERLPTPVFWPGEFHEIAKSWTLLSDFYFNYSIVYMYHIFFIHQSVDERLGCFHVLVIVNSAKMNVGMYVCF